MKPNILSLLSLCFWNNSPLLAFSPIFAVLAAALLSTEATSGQETDRYKKAAKQLVELINAGDYAGIQTNFNKRMDAALPLSKATPFFAGMNAQFGKIQKLDEPTRSAGWTVFPAHFERGLMDMSLALDREDKIAGLIFKPRAASSEAAPKKQQAQSSQTDRYTKVVNQLMVLINAGDYPGIQSKFNKEMGAALPLDKSSEFFKGLTQQMGKIQKLGKPQPVGEAMVFRTEFEKGKLDMQIALDRRGLIAGLEFKPHAATKPEPEKHEARLSQADLYTKVANQLMGLINAGDYAGIQAKFNKEMGAALPLDKSSEFFKGLTQQVGKIKKLGKPQPDGEAMVFPTEFENDTLDMQIALDDRGLIAGLEFKPHAVR